MPFCGCDCAYTMADVNVNAPAKQAPAMAPPTHTDEQILPRSRWVPFWDTVRYDKTTRSYSCQLDEQWFDLTKDTLKDALQITPVDNNNAFSSPPTPNVLIKFVNNLGYPKVVRTLSDVVTNDMFQPWRELTRIINLYLTGKTSGFERPSALVLQILWGIVKRAHIDYAERMWEEFTQSIHTFIEDKKNLAQHTQGKKKATLIVIPSVSAKGTKREVFGMRIPNNLITADIQGEKYYNAYLEKVAKHQRYIADEEVSDPDSPAPKPAKATKPKATKQSKPLAPKSTPVTKPAAAKAPKTTASRPPKPTPITTEPSKKDQSKKCKLVKESSEAPSPAKQPKAGKVIKKRTQKSSHQLVDEFIDEGVPVNEPRFGDEEADLQKAVEESLKDVHAAHQSPLPPVVIREPESGKFQPLSEVQGKAKKKVELGLTDSETESDEEVPGIDVGYQDEGQAGPKPGIQDEGLARSNPGDTVVSQPQPSHVVHAGPNLEYMDVEVTDTSIQQNPKQMDEEFTTMTYPNVQENLKLPTEDQVRLEEPTNSAGTLSSLQNLDKEFSFTNQFLEEKSQEDEPKKTNTESEVQLMVKVPIHQDTSSVPLMTTPVIDLTVSQPVSTMVQAPLPTLTATVTAITTTTSLLPPPTQPQQGSSDLILIQRISELEQHMANLLQDNLALEERLDKHGSKLYRLENLDIPHQVSKAADEIVTDAVDWAIKAPLRDRFRDLPEADMKEILHRRMWETKSYEAHEDHKKLYEDLENSMDRDHSEQLLIDLAEVQRKKKMRHESPKTPPGSLPHQPPPPLPPAGPSGTLGALTTLAEYMAWMTTDTRLNLFVSSIPKALHMDADSAPDKQASALASTYAPPPENSLLTQTVPNGRMPKLLIDQVDNTIIRHNVSKPLPLGGQPGQVTIQADFFFNKVLEYLRYGSKGGRPALSISKMKAAYYPDVGLEQMVPDQMWIEEECKYDIAAIAVRTHICILSVVRIEVFSVYGYNYMKTIVLRRDDLNEYIITERDFKYLYPSDFEDLYLLNLQGHLNHLPPQDKKILSTVVNLWIRNMVIRQRVKDFQLGIESYQTQLNLTKPRWDATGL
ncbi:retrovirus-related pol polyprotein from transposon TNT 1-94 [Tanacetum coccineum]